MKETTKYNVMISAFSADFWLAQRGHEKLNELQEMIDNKDENLIKDIELLDELDFNLRHNKVMIVEVETK